MFKRGVVFSFIVVFALSLSGCATGRKQKDMEIQGLRNQVSALESQIQYKDEEINSLKEELTRAPAQETKATSLTKRGKKRVIGEVKSRPNVKQIQIALRNAGFDPGAVDGRKGRQTRSAIRAFQSAQNLPVDGKVGNRTWSLLKEYLYQKVK